MFASELDKQLAENRIASIQMPIGETDFAQLIDAYKVCIAEAPEFLAQTSHRVDARFGSDAGYERKERKLRPDGTQIQDPKHLMHFNGYARKRWNDEFINSPRIFRDFLSVGHEIHDALANIVKNSLVDLEETHPNIGNVYFPGRSDTPNLLPNDTYMRLIEYDAYESDDSLGEVAKPHYDISGFSLQAYADSPGFWGAKDGPSGNREYHNTALNEAYLFMGYSHKKLYGKNTRLQPLWHGVDRLILPSGSIVPTRHAVILFVNPPLIDVRVRPKDTLPYMAGIDGVATY